MVMVMIVMQTVLSGDSSGLPVLTQISLFYPSPQLYLHSNIISKKFEEVEILDFYSISLFIGKGRKKGQRANFKKPSPILLTHTETQFGTTPI